MPASIATSSKQLAVADATSRREQEAGVVELLSPGCQELGLSAALASELFRFLCVRFKHPDAGPSTTIDRLWHWMLLNTHVRVNVEALMGGDVQHFTSTASDPLHAKTMRRLVALNGMRAACGEPPCEEFWREPGKPGEPGMELSRVAVLNARGVHTGRRVFVARGVEQSAGEFAEVVALARGFCVTGETLEQLPAQLQARGLEGGRSKVEGPPQHRLGVHTRAHPRAPAGAGASAHAAGAGAAATVPAPAHHPRGLGGVKRGHEADQPPTH
ncbi:hypothetical protein FOA52_014351 [Chlamydomonas sp. UWO 241]|nr:hypothetical protein FOA52_014351 [Chlamydomonas sp. UWO 241]